MNRNNFLGLSGFVWWVGVIETRVDPLGIGRCQVRIFGWHTDDKSALPTSDLPWAHPMLPINTSKSFQVPRIGDWIVGFFMDGESGQMPIMMGVLPGILANNTASNTGIL
jgi:hypothetical protein